MRARKLYKHCYSPPTKWLYGNPFTCFEAQIALRVYFLPQWINGGRYFLIRGFRAAGGGSVGVCAEVILSLK